MKKTILRILLALFAVLIIGGGAAWWVTTAKTKQSVIDAIARINAHKAADGSSIEITYAAVETAGFPPSITVRLVDPVLVIKAPATTQPAAAASVISWAYKGYADVVTNHLGAAYELVLSGDDTFTITQGETSSAITGSGSTYHFAVKAKSLEHFLAWEKIDFSNPAQAEAFIDSIREARADVGALSYKDAASGEPAFSHEKGLFSFVNRSDANAFDFDLEVLAKNSELYPAYGALLDKLSGSMSVSENIFGAGATPFSAANAGKQNVEINLSGYITRNKEKGNRTMRISMPRFSLSNNYYDIQLPLGMDVAESEGGTDFKAKLDAKINFTAAGAADAHKSLGALYAMLPMMTASNPSFNEAAFKEKVAGALPTVSTLGPITFAVDIDGKIAPRGEAGLASKGNVNLGQLELSHARWGLKADGHIDNTGEIPNITINLNCMKCDTMTADTMKSAIDAQLALAMLEPGRPLYPLGDEMLKAIDGLFAHIGKKDTASGDVLFAITTPAANDIRIGEQPLAAAMMQAMTTLAPFLTPQVPGAAVQGAIEGATDAPAPVPVPLPAQ